MALKRIVWSFITTAACAGLLAFVPAMYGQNPQGSLRGTVMDSSGALVPSAKIVAQAAESSVQREAVSDARGEFRIDNLTPGPYRVTVNATGFASAQADVEVIVSFVQEVTVTMKPQPVQQTVTVEGEASSITTEPIDSSSAVHQAAITVHDLESIPLAHRSFANIAYLAPGTEPVEPSDPTKARITAVSTGGSSGLNIAASVDGGDNSDDYIGGFLQNFSPDAIQEFAVRTSQEDADTAGTTGASVVISTKHGTDNWHGEGAFYERASALNARLPIDNPPPAPKQPFSRQNYVGTLGGPVEKGKVWFFSSLEYVHEDASIAYSPTSVTQFTALSQIAAQGLIPGINAIPVTTNTPVPFKDLLATARLDWAQSARSQWFMRAALDRYSTHNDLVQQATLASTGATSRSNYLNLVIGQQTTFSPSWLGTFTFDASALHHTEARNSNFGFALAFPFSSTASTISGFETFGDNQFVTPITAFPVLRNQEKYQVRYDVSRATGDHALRFGVSFIHEPVLSGALAATAETLLTYPNNPDFYAANPSQFFFSAGCVVQPPAGSGIGCVATPAGDGSFSQNVQRLGLYVQDAWRLNEHLTVNYGLRYDTTFGLFTASGVSQAGNPALLTLQTLQIPLVNGIPHDYRAAIAPRLGLAYAPGKSGKTVLRAGVGLYYNDLAQTGWVGALQSVNTPSGPCVTPGVPPCLAGAAANGNIGTLAGSGAAIDPHYKTPYALHASAGVQHAFNSKWIMSADWVHESGVHAYRRYQYQAGFTLFSPLFAPDVATQRANVPNITLFRTDNRSRYDALQFHLQGNISRHFNLTANYTLASAKTWGCILGEIFDYVNGVCNPLHSFAPGDYGPSGEDVPQRFVVAGTFYTPGGFQLTLLGQGESARPYTLTTPVPSALTGDAVDNRAVVNGVMTPLDLLRGTPYIQFDLRVSRPFNFQERWQVNPFIEFFNIFNRNNSGANYVTNVAALANLPPGSDLSNLTQICANPACTSTMPITSLNQLRQPAGALGDFFGPGTTVGIPFAAQVGVRITF